MRFEYTGYSVIPLALISLLACAENNADSGPPDLALRLENDQVRAGVTEKREDLIGGLRAEGQVGDFKIYNSQAAFIIENIRRTGGYRYYGGTLVDADLIRPDEVEGRDKFGEVFFAWNLQAFSPNEAEIVSDGRDGKAHIRFTGQTDLHPFADDAAGAILNPPMVDLEITYDYYLEANSKDLRLVITTKNHTSEGQEVDYPLVLSNHGNGVHQFEPGQGFRGGRYGDIPYIAAVGRDLSYAAFAADRDMTFLFQYEDVSLIITEPFTLHPGTSISKEYYFTVTGQSAAGIEAASRRLLEDRPTGTISGSVTLPETTTVKDSWIAVMLGEEVLSLAPIDQSGGFSLDIEPGDYSVYVFAHGHAPPDPKNISVAEGKEVEVNLALAPSSIITSSVSDPNGNPVMARVTFFRIEDTPSPYAPAVARLGTSWGRDISAVAYVVDSSSDVVLPAGTYKAIASRGPTWEIEQQTIIVSAGEKAELSFIIEQSVDTSGWVSGDMHVHGYKSPDSHVPYRTRVLQAATEGLDLPIISEHVWVSDLQNTVDEMGLSDEVIGISAQEVTTFTHGHFVVFPLLYDPSLPNHGGVFEHQQDPIELFEAMRNQHAGDTIIQIAHPRGPVSASSYFTWVGLDPLTGEYRQENGWTLDWDLIEVFNGNCGSQRNLDALPDWIGLNNLGHRKGISSGTDSHSEQWVPGIPRNWINADREKIIRDHQNLVEPLRARRSFVSCGPFVRFEAADGTGLGGMTTADAEGKVEFRIKVEAPTWMQIDELHLLENGVPIEIIDMPQDQGEVVRFDDSIVAEPNGDAWYAVEVFGSGPLDPVSWSGPPYAITNPIEVDADGDGVWTPPAL